MINLFDRIKERSHSTGVGLFTLDGAVNGFSAFGDKYNYNDFLFYAISDGTDYEIGSGQYINDGGTNKLRRFPFNSTNGNNAVNFSTGVKEVYVTLPGQKVAFIGNGLEGFSSPAESGLAFWSSTQGLNYDGNLIWDKDNNYLGITQINPSYAIDIGGGPEYSAVKASGFITGNSGVYFNVPGFSGGRQVEPFFRSQLDAITGTNAVFELSGTVGEKLLFQEQNAGLVFAGPPSGCSPPSTCSPDYPSFRALVAQDIPDLSSLYASHLGNAHGSGVAIYNQSGVLDYDPYFVYDKTNNYLGINIQDPAHELDIQGSGRFRGGDVFLDRSIVFTPITNGNQPSHQEGLLFYDDDNKTLSLYNDQADVSVQLGQENLIRVRNNTGATLINGTLLTIIGSHGSVAPTVSGAIANTAASAHVVGVATHDISHNSFGWATTLGLVRNIDTSQFAEGDEVHLSDTLIGSGQPTAPDSPNFTTHVGHIIRSHISNGIMLVDLSYPSKKYTTIPVFGTVQQASGNINYTSSGVIMMGNTSLMVSNGSRWVFPSKSAITTATDAATITFDLDQSEIHTVALSGNRTLAVSNADVGQKFIIRLTQSGSGNNTVTWFNTIRWPGGLTPTLTTTAGKTDVFGFINTSGNNYDGFVIGYDL